MTRFLIILIIFFCTTTVKGQTISASRVVETTTKQFVSGAQKAKWDAAAVQAIAAGTQAAAAATAANNALTTAKLANSNANTSTRIVALTPGLTFKMINDSTMGVIAELPLKMSTADRDTLNIRNYRGLMIYNVDKDAMEICNGVRWDQVTTGIVISQLPLTAPTKTTEPKKKK